MDDAATLHADIASRLSISHLPEAEQHKIIDELTLLIIERTQLEIWKRLSIEERKAFAALQKQEDITKFMAEKVTELKSIIELSTAITIDQFKASL